MEKVFEREKINPDLKPGRWFGGMDGYLVKNLTAAKNVISKDWDMVFVVDGYEGCGKSVLTQQMAYFCDPTITIDRICFSPEEFKEAINKANKYEAIIFDEAYGGMSSRSAMSEVNKSLMSMLAEIRQKNLFVFLVLPCFFELDKYAAIWRSRALIHVYTGKEFQRGLFSFYGNDRKKALYMFGKKFYSYSHTKPNFHGSFPKGYVVDEEEYRKKKLKALSVYSEEDKPKKPKRQMELERYLYSILQFYKYKLNHTWAGIGEAIGMSEGVAKSFYYSLRDQFEGGVPVELTSTDKIVEKNTVNEVANHQQ